MEKTGTRKERDVYFRIRPNIYPEITLPIKVYIPFNLWKKRYDYVCSKECPPMKKRDVDECGECGRLSAEHLKAISDFIYKLENGK